ncbi:Phage tail protein [compost metagenome]
MTIAESLHFVYDGIRSDEMGLINVNMSTGMQEQLFLPEQNLKEITVRGRDTPYFIETERKPFILSLNFAFTEYFDNEQLNKVANWLSNQPYYKPLYFSDDLDKWYYTLYTGEAKLLHNCLKQGTVQIQMRSMSPYTYSPVYESDLYDFSRNSSSGSKLMIENKGNMTCKPVLSIRKIGDGELSIVNLSNQGKTFRIVNLRANEELIIYSEQEEIVSNIPLTYHFDDAYGDFPCLVEGANYFKVYGDCQLKWKYQFRYVG